MIVVIIVFMLTSSLWFIDNASVVFPQDFMGIEQSTIKLISSPIIPFLWWKSLGDGWNYSFLKYLKVISWRILHLIIWGRINLSSVSFGKTKHLYFDQSSYIWIKLIKLVNLKTNVSSLRSYQRLNKLGPISGNPHKYLR